MKLLRILGAFVFAQSILETIVDIFDPLVGMGRGTSPSELVERTRGASFVDKLFTPFSGKLHDSFSHTSTCVGILNFSCETQDRSSFVERQSHMITRPRVGLLHACMRAESKARIFQGSVRQ